MESLDNYINFQQPTLYYAMANIMFNPIFWNVAARVGTGKNKIIRNENFNQFSQRSNFFFLSIIFRIP